MRFLHTLVGLATLCAAAQAQTAASPPADNWLTAIASTWAAPQKPHPAVARIVVPEHEGMAFGSGTLVDANEQYGLVVTNWHVVEAARGTINVQFPDGFQSPAEVLKTDHDWDLAALRIRKPNAAPVRLATKAPAPGEPLSIAGYGSGTYRAVSGRCTQYVAPGPNFPYEMVELSAGARQGDSGGPIFNSSGQLAGVLFGESRGKTSGSYCGRVHQFLASLPAGRLAPALIAQGAPLYPPRQTSVASVGAIVVSPAPPPMPPTPIYRASLPKSVPDLTTPPPSVAPQTADTGGGWRISNRFANSPAPRPAELVGDVSLSDWQRVAGETVFDQLKTSLAIIGAMSLLVLVLRTGRKPAVVKAALR